MKNIGKHTAEAVKAYIKKRIESMEIKISGLEKAIGSIPVAKDGEHGRDGRDGKDGIDGRDALDLEILPNINPDKQYSADTYARHKGGIWKASSNTNGMNGWECMVEGIADIDIIYDGHRNISIKVIKSSGEFYEKSFDVPVMIHKGIWREGDYKKGDTVQLSGSLWIATEDNSERPGGESKCWQVAAKRGGTGDSAYQIARKNGFDGSVIEWLNGLGKKPKVGL